MGLGNGGDRTPFVSVVFQPVQLDAGAERPFSARVQVASLIVGAGNGRVFVSVLAVGANRPPSGCSSQKKLLKRRFLYGPPSSFHIEPGVGLWHILINLMSPRPGGMRSDCHSFRPALEVSGRVLAPLRTGTVGVVQIGGHAPLKAL